MDWNGAFVPRLSKSIGKVTYIPMWKMTHSDWKVLDWNALRNAAKNDIVKAASEDRIAGFMHVNFLQKGSQAAGYYMVVPAAQLVSIDTLISNPPLRNTPDDAELTKAAQGFDKAVAAAELLLIMASTKKPSPTTDSQKTFLVKRMHLSILPLLDGEEKDEAEEQLQKIIDNEFVDFNELDYTLTWAMSVLHKVKLADERKYEWLQEWVDDAEQIMGEAEDAGLV